MNVCTDDNIHNVVDINTIDMAITIRFPLPYNMYTAQIIAVFYWAKCLVRIKMNPF